MAIPSKPQQVKAVMSFLDADFQEGRSLEEIAKAIVEGYHDVLTKSLHPAPSTPRLGMLFKMPVDSKVRRWVWEGEGKVWIVGESDSYGWLGHYDQSSMLELCEEYRPSAMRDLGEVTKEGKPKKTRVELTDEEIDAEWGNPDYKVGEILSQHQRQYRHEVVAVALKSVLLRNALTGVLTVDTNSNLEKHYKREKVAQEW